jgi:hypothetical protein
MEIKLMDRPEVQAALEAAAARGKELEAMNSALREGVDRLLAGARSFCESWPYTAPEALHLQWRSKVQPGLAELDALLHPCAEDDSRKD